jgi:ATP-binding cassette, subfamily B, bacterial
MLYWTAARTLASRGLVLMSTDPAIHPSTLPSRQGEFFLAGAPTYDRRGPLRWVVSHLLRYWPYFVFFVVASVMASVLFSVVPRMIGLVFDLVLAGADPSRLLWLAFVLLGITVVRGLLDLGGSLTIETLAQRLERDARDELYLGLLGKSQTFHNRQRVGDIMARANNDVRQLNAMMNPGVALIFTDTLLGLIVPIVFIGFLDARLLVSPLAFVVVFVLAVRLYMRQLDPVSSALRRQFGVLNAGLNETITGIEVVKAVVQEDQERRKFRNDARAYRDYFVRQGLVQARYLPVLLVGIAITAAFAHGVWLVSMGELTTGELVAYVGLMGLLRFPAFISIFSFSLVQLGLAGASRILELLRTETELDENVDGHAAPIAGEIVFEDVSFAYEGAPDGKMALRDISFRARPGQTVAVVGQTGSGKSTLTKLVNRAYDVTAGRILVDGVDLRDWNMESLRSQVSVIEQDVFLFSRSIEENIGFGLGDRATRATIVAAAKAAQAHDFIESFAEGYATVVGERGATLSGGQRQRIAIARALLTDPRVLILDDSTSAVDSATEDAIQRAINVVLEGRTTLMITHRLSQIRRADLVLVIHGGRLIDQGTHHELLGRCDLYARIFARYD